MQKLALGVEYQGTAYCGWQFQSHCDSVQKHLQLALSEIANELIMVYCAGRTDSGVHAIGQVVHFETRAIRSDRAWLEGVNTKLPRDIRIAWVKAMPNSFHARFSAIGRQYRYVIFNRSVPSAILANRVAWEGRLLDEAKMHQAAQALSGEQDFSSFRASACQAAHARRDVQSISVSRQGNFVMLDIQANAFLHHMVRNIAGTLIEVGRGGRPISWVSELLTLQDRRQAGMTASATGLYFVNALYPDALAVPRAQLNEVLWAF